MFKVVKWPMPFPFCRLLLFLLSWLRPGRRIGQRGDATRAPRQGPGPEGGGVAAPLLFFLLLFLFPSGTGGESDKSQGAWGTGPPLPAPGGSGRKAAICYSIPRRNSDHLTFPLRGDGSNLATGCPREAGAQDANDRVAPGTFPLSKNHDPRSNCDSDYNLSQAASSAVCHIKIPSRRICAVIIFFLFLPPGVLRLNHDRLSGS